MRAVLVLLCAIAVSKSAFANPNDLSAKRVYSDQSVTMKAISAVFEMLGGEGLPIIASTDGKVVSLFQVDIGYEGYERWDIDLKTGVVSEFMCGDDGETGVVKTRQLRKNLIGFREFSESADVFYNGEIFSLSKVTDAKAKELSGYLSRFRRLCGESVADDGIEALLE